MRVDKLQAIEASPSDDDLIEEIIDIVDDLFSLVPALRGHGPLHKEVEEFEGDDRECNEGRKEWRCVNPGAP